LRAGPVRYSPYHFRRLPHHTPINTEHGEGVFRGSRNGLSRNQ
jgi:hypothetical protein